MIEMILGISCLANVVFLFLLWKKDQKIITLSTTLELKGKESEDKISLLQQAKEEMSNSFKALSSDTLKTSTTQFLELATEKMDRWQQGAKQQWQTSEKTMEELMKPLHQSLNEVKGHVSELEKARSTAYTSLTEQVKHLSTSQTKLHKETENLVKALRMPHVRGRWGEIQLKRVVEMAGMIEHCDFAQQEVGDDGRLRPDMVVHLPGEKEIVIDSKTPLYAYLEAIEADNEETRLEKLKAHAKQVRTHIMQLGAKNYWEQFKQAPEFVVLFLPGEPYFSAALEQDPELIEFGVDKKVIIATPTTLIALLRSVAFGWRQEAIAKNAQEISALGQTLYERIRVLSTHFGDMKKGLDRAVEGYNKAMSSFETRVVVSAKKFKELGVSQEREIVPTELIDKSPRELM